MYNICPHWADFKMFFRINVGQYSSPMDGLGMLKGHVARCFDALRRGERGLFRRTWS